MIRATLLTTLLLAASTALAAPAAWHIWRSKLDGRPYCAQSAPGPGWEWAHGPFRDSRCLTYTARPTPSINHPKQGVDLDQQDPISASKSHRKQ